MQSPSASVLIYGESADAGLGPGAAATSNLLGQVYQHYDEAGRVTLNDVDFKGNPLDKVREVITDDLVAGQAHLRCRLAAARRG